MNKVIKSLMKNNNKLNKEQIISFNQSLLVRKIIRKRKLVLLKKKKKKIIWIYIFRLMKMLN